jgi:hypothetical protein
MSENSMPQESMAPEIGRLIKEVQSLQNQTSQLQQTTNALKDGQDELARMQQTQGRLLSKIQSLTIEHQRALEQQNKSLAEILENQITLLKDVELLKADNAIIKQRLEIHELERREQQFREQRLQQLVTTFQSLHKAVVYVSKQEDYFEKYVWLVYFRNKIGTKDLRPNELTSLSDRIVASQAIETFEQEFSKSEKALTKKDKKDIDTSASLVIQIPNEETKLNELKRFVSQIKDKLLSLESKLKRINEKGGYSQTKLLIFKVWGLISLIVGLLLSAYGFLSNKGAIQTDYAIPAIGLGLFIIGILLLWLRYNNDKQNRLKEATKKWEDLNSQHSQRNDELKALQVKIVKDKNELEDIYKRRPVLKAVGISYN